MSWELFNDLISNHHADLIDTLVNSGFSLDQANRFLPEAGQGIVEAFGDARDLVELVRVDTETAVSSVQSKVDTPSIASKAGVDESMVNKGYAVLIPKVLELAKAENGGVLAFLAGEAGENLWGGFNDMMKKLWK
jgi:hypothetical protein